jgi:hypothetical protein
MDDNIFISHSDKQSDVYFSLSPGFAAGWGDFRSALVQNATGFADEYGQTRAPVDDPTTGDYAYFNYTADAMHFLSHDSEDAVNQDAVLNTQSTLGSEPEGPFTPLTRGRIIPSATRLPSTSTPEARREITRRS